MLLLLQPFCKCLHAAAAAGANTKTQRTNSIRALKKLKFHTHTLSKEQRKSLCAHEFCCCCRCYYCCCCLFSLSLLPPIQQQQPKKTSRGQMEESHARPNERRMLATGSLNLMAPQTIKRSKRTSQLKKERSIDRSRASGRANKEEEKPASKWQWPTKSTLELVKQF